MRTLALACAFLVAAAWGALAQTCPTGPAYYVSSAGSDTAAGTSASTAWKTLAKLSAAKLPANSCVHLMTALTGNLVLNGANMSGPMGVDGGNNTLTAGSSASPAISLTNLPLGVTLLNLNVRPAVAGAGTGVVSDKTTVGSIVGFNASGFPTEFELDGTGMALINDVLSASGANGMALLVPGAQGDIQLNWSGGAGTFSSTTSALCAPSAAGTVVTTVGPTLTMKTCDVYALTSGGQISVNGTVLPESASVMELWTDGTALWQEAGVTGSWGPLWWEKADGAVATAWTPDGGQVASPVVVIPPPPPDPIAVSFNKMSVDLQAAANAAASRASILKLIKQVQTDLAATRALVGK